MAEVDYGLDAPKLVRRFTSGAILFIVCAVILFVANRNESPRQILPLVGVLLAIGLIYAMISGVMVWSSRVAKPKIRDRMLDGIPWRGDEGVLDVGCGRGLFLISAAKRLKTGKATGIDVWRAEDLSGNSAEAALRNAKAENVAGRVKIETADARELPFAADSFDVVVSSLALHNISSSQERTKALHEIARVLKPGGYLAILDIFYGGEYAKTFRQIAWSDVRLSPRTFLWCVPTRILTARKPPQ